MKTIRTFFRMLYIAHIVTRYRLDELASRSGWLYPFRFISYLNPWRYISLKKLSRGERLRLALERLGPIYVKFGQLLSTRRDLIPNDVAEELSKLQDQVKPFPSKKARQIIEKSLNSKLEDHFDEFSNEALASASIAQVHSAKLKTGESVVIKVLRPNVHKQIGRDIDLLKMAAKFANFFLPNADRIRPRDIVSEFELSLRAELDLLREASNASLLKRNASDSDKLYIPAVYFDLCRKNILVMERIYGIPIDDITELKKHHVDLELLAQDTIEVFFQQVFEHNFFHADMHPGNLFVSLDSAQQIIAVDFGIVGSLSNFDRRYVAENLLAFLKRDYRRVAELHVECGWVDNDINLIEFEAAIRSTSEPLFERPLKEISFGTVMLNLFRIAREFNINIQPQLILLQKTWLNVEGLGRHLYPDLDLWQTAKPYLEGWMKSQVGIKALFKNIKTNLPLWIEKFPEMPELVYDTLRTIKLHFEQKPNKP